MKVNDKIKDRLEKSKLAQEEVRKGWESEERTVSWWLYKSLIYETQELSKMHSKLLREKFKLKEDLKSWKIGYWVCLSCLVLVVIVNIFSLIRGE